MYDGPVKPLEEKDAEIARLQARLDLMKRAKVVRMSERDFLLAVLDGNNPDYTPDPTEIFMLHRRAVEIMREQPDIEYYPFAREVGLTEINGQLGLTGSYMQFAREVLKREQTV